MSHSLEALVGKSNAPSLRTPASLAGWNGFLGDGLVVVCDHAHQGRVKLADFGLVRRLDDVDAGTQSGTSAGEPDPCNTLYLPATLLVPLL